MMDLWNQLKREGGINHITPHWQSKQIIASAPDDCTCLPPAKAISMTEHTSNSSSSKLAKQLRFRNEHATSIDEYPEVSVNMVERDTGKHPASDPENSATPGVYMSTHSRSGATRPINYRTLVQELDMPKEQSIIEKFQSSSFLRERPVPPFVANAPKEVAWQLALQAQTQQEQQQQLRAHAHSIDLLKLMLQQVLEQVSKKKSKHASSTSHNKDKENSDLDSSVRSHSLPKQEDKVEPYSVSDNQSITEPESKANNDDIAQRIKQLEEQVAAMRTNSIQQTTEELVACAKTGGKNKQLKLNKAQSKRNKKAFAKE